MNKLIRKITALAAAGLVVLLASGCTNQAVSDSSALQQQSAQDTAEAFKLQVAAQPYPKDELVNSLERANLKERLLRTNKPNAIGYLYMVNFGKIFGYYTVKGKVSSTQSQMTTDQLVVRNCQNGDCAWSVVNAPGDDGSYGINEGGEKGSFFFTQNGAFVETSLDFIWSDQPLPIDVPLLDPEK